MTRILLLPLLAVGWICMGAAQAEEAPGPPSARPASSQPVVAIAADVSTSPGKTRLAVTLSGPVNAQAFLIGRPARAIIDLSEVNFQLPAGTGRGREGLIAAFRYGLYAPGRSRIVIDLAQPALVSKLEVKRRPDGAYLLSVDMAHADREAFNMAISSGERAAHPASPVEARPPEDRRPVIAIDAGHGGVDPGATPSPGVYEKDIVLGFARELRSKLERSGRYRVFMTRDEDVFVPLDERVQRARAAKADLFISIHADSIPGAPIRGATVYTGAERATDDEAARLAERENAADANAGIVTADENEGVTDILQDLTRRETRGFSHRFAKQLIGELHPLARLTSHPHREAGFRVLRASDIPSVLLELGYLSSSKDVSLLTSEDWRESVTTAMSGAVDRFFAARLANQGPAPVSP